MSSKSIEWVEVRIKQTKMSALDVFILGDINSVALKRMGQNFDKLSKV